MDMQEIEVLFTIDRREIGVMIGRIWRCVKRGTVNSQESVTHKCGIWDIFSGKSMKKELENRFLQFIPLLNEGGSSGK